MTNWMRTIMALQIFRPGEGELADVACEWPDFRMFSCPVILQVISPEERLRTEFTFVWSFSCVIAHMPLTVRFCSEKFPAVLTEKPEMVSGVMSVK